MQPDLQPEEMRLYRLCDEALYYVWDPLGASGAPESRDEYRAYVPQVYELVRRGKRDELTAYLTSVLRDRMELPAEEAYSAAAVDFMMRGRAWYERNPYGH
jgi:hypothetical protein